MCGDQPNLSFGRFNIGNVDRLEVTAKKDGAAWNLTGGSVSLTFLSPSGQTFSRDCVAGVAASGLFYYDTLTTDFTEVGLWMVAVTATDGSIVKTYPYDITMELVSQPG